MIIKQLDKKLKKIQEDAKKKLEKQQKIANKKLATINNINEIDNELVEFYSNISLPDIDDLLILGEDGIYYRKDDIMITKNQRHEFWLILKLITGLKFSAEQWTPLPENDEINEGDQDIWGNGHVHGFCLCTHVIHRYFCIENNLTKRQYCVGCDCVNKADPELYKQMTKKTIKCTECSTELKDRRSKCRRKGFCDDECEKKHSMKIVTKVVDDIVCGYWQDTLYKGGDYLEWIGPKT